VATAQVAIVNALNLDDLLVESPSRADGERNDAIFFTFAIADHDLLAGEINIFEA
jgi:hypothetical protein